MDDTRQNAERIVSALELELGTLDTDSHSRLVDAVEKSDGKTISKGLRWDLRRAWPRRPERDITRRYERETA